jgi:hypothetical protein
MRYAGGDVVTEHSGVRLPGPRATPVVSIRMLGAFAVDVDGRPVALPAGAQRLVALLALRGRTGRSRLAGLLWSGTTEHRALASLRTGIWRVNQAAPGLVVSAHGIVELGLAADVDVTDLIDRAHAVLNGAADPVAPVDGGVGPGELLPDWDDPWLDAERERLHQLRLHVLEAAARQLADQGHYGLAPRSGRTTCARAPTAPSSRSTWPRATWRRRAAPSTSAGAPSSRSSASSRPPSSRRCSPETSRAMDAARSTP